MSSAITLDVPDELAGRLRPLADQLQIVLELGLRELDAAQQPGFEGSASVFEFLAALPEPEEVLALRPSPILEERIKQLLEKSRTTGLTDAQEQEWRQYEYLEHLVRLAKAKAHYKLARQSPSS